MLGMVVNENTSFDECKCGLRSFDIGVGGFYCVKCVVVWL